MSLHPSSRLSERARKKSRALEGESASNTTLYWNAFKITQRAEINAPVMRLLLAPTSGVLTWASGNIISICDGTSVTVKKKLSKSKEDITCIAYRPDGKLLLAGCASGLVHLHDVKSRSIMRTLSGHTKAITALTFLGTSGRALSASEDMTIALWDILGEKLLCRFEGHSDYVKSLASSLNNNPDIFYSGIS